jgi:hypothetical protein
MSAAYGGNTLKNASNLIIIESYKRTMVGQSETPEILNLRTIDRTAIIDFNNNKAQVTQSIKQREITFFMRRILNQGQYYNINLIDKTYSQPVAAKRQTVTGFAMLLNDIGVAKLLLENVAKVKLLADSRIEAIPFHNVLMTLPNGQQLTVSIDRKSGLIKRTSREHPSLGTIRTEFSNVVRVGNNDDQFAYAKDTEAFFGQALASVVIDREVKLNTKLPKNFARYSQYQQRSKDLYPEKMTVRQLSENTFLVGKAAVHSLFVVNGNKVIGGESYAGVVSRFEALKTHLAKPLVLTDLVVTHHHNDHLSGVNELASLTTNIITVKAHRQEILKRMPKDFDQSRFVFVDGERVLNHASFQSSVVKVFDIATAHSAHNLIMFVPEQKLIYAADYYRSSNNGEEIVGFTDLVNFRKAIDKLDVQAEIFASVHGIRVLTYQQLIDATDNYRKFNCQAFSYICQGENTSYDLDD